jgi:DNA-binding transcriptional LysR family regulator
VIFRIGVLTDSAFHARVFGQQCYHLAASPDYIRRHGMLGSPEELARHKCLVYRGRQDQTNGCCAGTERNGCTPVSP